MRYTTENVVKVLEAIIHEKLSSAKGLTAKKQEDQRSEVIGLAKARDLLTNRSEFDKAVREYRVKE